MGEGVIRLSRSRLRSSFRFQDQSQILFCTMVEFSITFVIYEHD